MVRLYGTPLANMVFKILSQDVVGQGVRAFLPAIPNFETDPE